MLINPDIEAWFEKLQGKRLGGGGSAPSGAGLPNYGSSAVQGIVRPGSPIFGFNAPAISARYRAAPPAPYPAERSPSPQNVPFQGISGGGRDLGGGAVAAGLGKLGTGIEGAMKTIAANKAARDALNQGYSPLPALNGPLSQQMSRNPGATLPPGVGTQPAGPAAPPAAPYSPAPVGAVSETPTIQAMDAVGAQPIPPIGTGSAPLPTFAQGGGGAASDQMARYGNAIASIESRGSGDYAAVGPVTRSGDRAYGRYQVMGNNIPGWTKAATGTAMTPQQFLADKGAQEAVFKNIFGGYVNQYGPQGAANMWFTGKPNPPATARDITGTAAPEYLRRFNNALGPNSGAPPPLTAPSAQAYAALPPSTAEPTAPRLAGAAPTPNSGGGFTMENAPQTPADWPRTRQEYIDNLNAGKGQSAPAVTPNAPASPASPATGESGVPVPPPRPADATQPPLLNGGQPGVYSMPDQQGMNAAPGGQQTAEAYPRHGETVDQYQYRQLQEQPGGIQTPKPPDSMPSMPRDYASQQDQLAAALANGGAPDVTPQLDQSAMLSMALAQPDFVAPAPDSAAPDFGGGFNFGGMFG